MLCYISESNDTSYNIAMEEYFLKNFDDDFFLLYQNEPSIVVGKHQNTLAEINLTEVKNQRVKVVRRLSGGGTVFHDMGNLNYCFILKGNKGELVNFRKHTQPILEVLNQLGVKAKFEGRNDLTIDGKKFSGNACHVYKNKVMQHGTMLFSSDLNRLNKLLKVNPLKFKDKAIRSIRSRVTNICEHLSVPVELKQLAEQILNHILTTTTNSKLYHLSPEDQINIQKLVESKYDTWEWNFGYSPKYNFEKLIQTPAGKILEVQLWVEKGIIQKMELLGNCILPEKIEEFKNQFENTPHDLQKIEERIASINLKEYFNDISPDQLLKGLS
ncbi:MAG: lipoate--protein ligase [Marinifilaceae bacterium]